MPPPVKLLVCDLDNTLYDWVHYFVASFYDMIEEVVRITDCERERLLDDFRLVHQHHYDSEHPFALLETKLIRDMFPNTDAPEIAKRLDSAFHAFNSRRKRELTLHTGVRETLEELVRNEVALVAHTESKLYGVVDRLTRLGLTKYFSRIYCRERSASVHPNAEIRGNWLASFPMEKVIELSHHQKKPSPEVLLEICRDQGVPTESVAYVGDSMARDILMAKRAGVTSVWAKYGAQHSKQDYERLVRVSHWTKADVEQEMKLARMAKSVVPDVILVKSFSEILAALGMAVPHSSTAAG